MQKPWLIWMPVLPTVFPQCHTCTPMLKLWRRQRWKQILLKPSYQNIHALLLLIQSLLTLKISSIRGTSISTQSLMHFVKRSMIPDIKSLFIHLWIGLKIRSMTSIKESGSHGWLNGMWISRTSCQASGSIQIKDPWKVFPETSILISVIRIMSILITHFQRKQLKWLLLSHQINPRKLLHQRIH
jgi:hypothetical protein